MKYKCDYDYNVRTSKCIGLQLLASGKLSCEYSLFQLAH